LKEGKINGEHTAHTRTRRLPNKQKHTSKKTKRRYDNTMSSSSSTEHTLRAIQLGAVPAACMALFTLMGLGKEVPVNLAGALQHFAAGILLCTIGTELLPEMVNAQGVSENVAAGVGFFLGVAVLILLGMFMPEEKEDEDDEKDGGGGGGGGTADNNDEDPVGVQLSSISAPPRRQQSIFDGVLLPGASSSVRNRGRQSLIAVARQCSVGGTASVTGTRTSSLAAPPPSMSLTEDTPLLSSKNDDDDPQNNTTTTKPFPATLLSAIAIDSALDGLLIGIASVAGPSAGPMMSLSLTVEMSFLGLTLATALNGQPNVQSYLASFLGPVVREYKQHTNKQKIDTIYLFVWLSLNLFVLCRPEIAFGCYWDVWDCVIIIFYFPLELCVV
jgi:zinc transporter ZupT